MCASIAGVGTTIDIEQRPRRRYRWLAALAVVLAAVVVALLLRGMGGSESPAAAEDERELPEQDERGLPEQLADRVVQVLEQATPQEHADHGHHFDEEAQGIVCAADTFGFEPADATSLDQVEVVYAQHMCAEYGPGLSWPGAVRASGPLAMELTTDPATVRLPEQALPGEEGVTHADRVRAIIPEEYHEEVLAADGFDPDVAETLRGRFEAANG